MPMRKIITATILCLSALTMWGQTDEASGTSVIVNNSVANERHDDDSYKIENVAYLIAEEINKNLLKSYKELNSELKSYKENYEFINLIIIILLILIGAIGVYLIIIVRGVQTEIRKLKNMVGPQAVEQSSPTKPLGKQKDTRCSNMRGASSQQPVQQSVPQTAPRAVQQFAPQTAQTTAEELSLSAQTQPHPQPAILNMYATVRAGADVAEFFRVSPDYTPDKVFMLVLAAEGADTATFTLASDMNSDFMKNVIKNRSIYLPPSFCQIESYAATPQRIEVTAPGKARKEDDKWLVERTMSVKLV